MPRGLNKDITAPWLILYLIEVVAFHGVRLALCPSSIRSIAAPSAKSFTLCLINSHHPQSNWNGLWGPSRLHPQTWSIVNNIRSSLLHGNLVWYAVVSALMRNQNKFQNNRILMFSTTTVALPQPQSHNNWFTIKNFEFRLAKCKFYYKWGPTIMLADSILEKTTRLNSSELPW